MRRYRVSLTLLAASAVLVSFPALAWAARCETYSGTVNWVGPSSNLYINTPVWACISDANGRCTAGGGYLLLENYSEAPVQWSSLAAGEPVFRPLGAGERLVRYLAIYRRPGEELRADLSVMVCEPDAPGQNPGAGNGGGNGSPGSGGGGGAGERSNASDTYFIDLNYTFSNHGDSRYQRFTLSRATTFDVRFVSDYSAQAALIPESQLTNFTSGLGFSGYALFDDRFGTRTAITIPAGAYYAAVRNRTSGSNTIRFEVDFRLSVPGAQFLGWDISASEMVQPRGGRSWHSFTIAPGVRYFIDGCNSGVGTYIIPNSEIGNFTNGRQFRYYVDYSAVDDNAAPGLWEVTLPPGPYWLVFRNQDSIAHAVTFQAERWSRSNVFSTTGMSQGRNHRGAFEEPQAETREGLRAGWIDRSALIHLKFSERIAAAGLAAGLFRIRLGDATLTAARVDYDSQRGIVTLVVPELRERSGSPTVSWDGLQTESGAVLKGATDPLPR